MNTLKRERIIKNLYDLQQLDSWEESRDFMYAVKAVMSVNDVLFLHIQDLIDIRVSYIIDNTPRAYKAKAIDDDETVKLYFKYEDSEEAFADLTNCAMTFEKFRALCLEYMDFSQLI